jgi:integrase
VNGQTPILAERSKQYLQYQREQSLSSEELGRLGAAILEAETVGIIWHPDPSKKVKNAPKEENRRVTIDSCSAAAFRLLLFTGARVGEILHLKWESVDLERGILFLPDRKAVKKFIVLNAPALMCWFPSQRSLRHRWTIRHSALPCARRWCRRAGRPPRGFDLRYTVARVGKQPMVERPQHWKRNDRLTLTGVRVALLFLFFHNRLCGPLARRGLSLFLHSARRSWKNHFGYWSR